jgi:nitronate monooxygenase
MTSSFCDLVGCRLPLQLAAMGAVGTPELAAAVTAAGGLGMIPLGSPSQIASNLERVRSATEGPVGVNFLMPFLDRDALDVASRDADVVEFFYGDPDPDLVSAARRGRASIVGWQVGSLGEAVEAEKAGCDYVVVQGHEAGGHVRGRVVLDEVLAETLGILSVPVVAAGGIGTTERVVSVLAAGASAVRIGTRFVAAAESGAHPAYVEALIGAGAEDTCVTEAFGAEWPHAPHRVLRSALAAAEELDTEIVGTLGGHAIARFSSLPPSRGVEGNIGAMALYAGESVDAVTAVKPAAEIVAELMPG